MAIIRPAAGAVGALLAAASTCIAFLQPPPLQSIKNAHHVSSPSRLHVASVKTPTTDTSDTIGVSAKPQQITADKLPPPPFAKVLAANRAEISVRIQRAVTELNMASVAIYVEEDKYGQHRWGADESYVNFGKALLLSVLYPRFV